MENNNSGRKEAIEQELIRGRDVAKQLLEVLIIHKSNRNEEGIERSMVKMPFVEDAVRKILISFTNTLLLFNSDTQHNRSDIHQGCKKSKRPPTLCHKRKSFAPTWSIDNAILSEDGLEWRKYGQKKTKDCRYIRSYYKCSYKNEEDCKAIKHVQRIQEDPPLYRTTYSGHHTCKCSFVNYPHMKLESAPSLQESSKLLSFNNNYYNNNTLQSKEMKHLSSSISSTKQEPVEVIIPNDDHNQIHLLSDCELDFNYSSTESVAFDIFMGMFKF
ncbi:hypothetical protein HN51_026458 [Arachis hypogaea]|uniref:probable WRKY transcription factor 62 n=1 Tax=Arachis hypogaea TaxID=3818 RepID=UPI000DEC6823|nr:probable WRKY transcription factor 62 [Arachis hypogaea]QHO29074.1 putative WRKY transcription factor [Arachis hypogaea]